MTDNKPTYTKVFCGIAVLAEKVSRLHLLKLVLKAAQEGEDFRPVLERLNYRTRSQASRNFLRQQISEMEELMLHNLQLLVAAQQKERKQIDPGAEA